MHWQTLADTPNRYTHQFGCIHRFVYNSIYNQNWAPKSVDSASRAFRMLVESGSFASSNATRPRMLCLWFWWLLFSWAKKWTCSLSSLYEPLRESDYEYVSLAKSTKSVKKRLPQRVFTVVQHFDYLAAIQHWQHPSTLTVPVYLSATVCLFFSVLSILTVLTVLTVHHRLLAATV